MSGNCRHDVIESLLRTGPDARRTRKRERASKDAQAFPAANKSRKRRPLRVQLSLPQCGTERASLSSAVVDSHAHCQRRTFLDVRLVPLVAVFLSAAVLLPTSTLYAKRRDGTSVARSKDGLVWKVFRAITTLALLSLSVFSGVAHEAPVLVKVSLILSTVRILARTQVLCVA
jgi:hypothetical protein